MAAIRLPLHPDETRSVDLKAMDRKVPVARAPVRRALGELAGRR